MSLDFLSKYLPSTHLTLGLQVTDAIDIEYTNYSASIHILERYLDWYHIPSEVNINYQYLNNLKYKLRNVHYRNEIVVEGSNILLNNYLRNKPNVNDSLMVWINESQSIGNTATFNKLNNMYVINQLTR